MKLRTMENEEEKWNIFIFGLSIEDRTDTTELASYSDNQPEWNMVGQIAWKNNLSAVAELPTGGLAGVKGRN